MRRLLDRSSVYAYRENVVSRGVLVDQALVEVDAYGSPAAVVKNAVRNEKLRGKRLAFPRQLQAKELVACLVAEFDHTRCEEWELKRRQDIGYVKSHEQFVGFEQP